MVLCAMTVVRCSETENIIQMTTAENIFLIRCRSHWKQQTAAPANIDGGVSPQNMEAIRAATSFSLNAVRSESGGSSSNGGASPPHDRNAASRAPLLSVSKPSWIVRTESNIRKERRQKPDPPCVVCRGNGRVECYDCNGRGRTNNVELEMLPKGKWPKWCRTCGGSGLNHCSRCLGTGEYRYIMGFGLMHRRSDDNEHGRINRVADRRRRIRSADDLLVNDEECL